MTLGANASTPIASFPVSRWQDPAASGAFAELHQGTRLVARNRLFLHLFKEIRWPAAQVQVDVRDGRAVFRSETFAWGVCLDLDGERTLADNFFDVYPGVPYEMEWTDARAPVVLRVGNLL